MWTINFFIWLLVSFVLYRLLKKLADKSRITPAICWAALALSFTAFLPNFSAVSETEVSPMWLTENTQSQLHLVNEVAKQSLSNSDVSPLLLLLFILITPSLYRLAQLAKRYRKAKALIKQGTAYEKVDFPCVVLPINPSPFVIGFLKPVIVLPQYFVHMSNKQQQVILQHEKTHIANSDHIASWVWLLCSEVCWFNPSIKKLNALFINAMEQRCDQHTISRYNFSEMDYASTLLTSIKLSQQPIPHAFSAQFNGQKMTMDEQKMRFSCIMSCTPILMPKILSSFALATLLLVFSKYTLSHIATSDEDWQYPVNTIKVSSHYGHVTAFRNRRPHRGVDFVDVKGSEINAARTGKVIVADNSTLPSRYGKTIVIQHSNGWQTLYAHLDEIDVTVGDWVKGGESIGKMGDTGRVTGTHLHFEMTQHGEYKDPAHLLPRS